MYNLKFEVEIQYKLKPPNIFSGPLKGTIIRPTARDPRQNFFSNLQYIKLYIRKLGPAYNEANSLEVRPSVHERFQEGN